MSRKTPKNYFVTYARGDKDIADELLDGLSIHLALSRQYEYSKWIDDYILPDNQEYHQKIIGALEQSDFALVLASPCYFTRPYILKNEIPPLLRDDEDRKLAIIVGLSRVDFDHHDLKGFEKFQFHLYNGKFYDECDQAEKKQFVASLFVAIEMILAP